jgi:23S rRNA (cytidine2498-2'-O)-methyltransferase
MESIICCCRPGFESEAGQELIEKAAEVGVYGYFRPLFAGAIIFTAPRQDLALSLWPHLHWRDLVFTRDWWLLLAEAPLPKTDRVGAVLEALDRALPEPTGRLEVQVPDGIEDPALHRFARKWTAPLSRALRDKSILDSRADAGHRLDILLAGFDKAWLCWSDADNRAPFMAGVARLKLPAQAPSRSTLKLEEAWHVFLGRDRFLELLGGGRQAVDLGAAPGGWTWQLVNQGMLVMAVDNGPMDADLMASGHVTHIRADGFSWRPKRGVDWLVCDIVDRPRRVASLMTDWFRESLCRQAIFNLKLPMKQRYQEWRLCQASILESLAAAGIEVHLTAKHLYHDREEITCHLARA